MPRMLSAQDVATSTNTSPSTVRLWVRNDGLPALRVGKVLRIPEDGLQKWLQARMTNTQG